MDLLMNGLLMAATLFAGTYCWVLARRVRDLKSLDKGLGGAIVTLTRQVELARTTLDEARSASKDTRQDLAQLIGRADGTAGQLRALLAAAPTPFPAPPAPPPASPAPLATAPVLADQIKPEPKAETASEPKQPDIPKPRALAPIENPLRRAKPAGGGKPKARSEDDILEALRALAGGD